MQMEAKEAGLDNGVFIDENGNVGESSNMNVAFVTRDGVLRHPKFDHILSGCTSLRLLELRGAASATGVRPASRCVTSRSPRRAPAARCCSSAARSRSRRSSQWDGQRDRRRQARSGRQALLELLEEDMRSGDRLIPVPY